MKIINGTKLKLNMILRLDDKIKHCVIGQVKNALINNKILALTTTNSVLSFLNFCSVPSANTVEKLDCFVTVPEKGYVTNLLPKKIHPNDDDAG